MKVAMKEVLVSLLCSVVIFTFLGSLTGLWSNPFFTRMTNVEALDYFILTVESILLGFLVGVKRGSCSFKSAGTGGVFAFLGFACPVCNKLLVLIFGGTFLLTYFEPIRHELGLFGIVILSYLLYKKLWQREKVM